MTTATFDTVTGLPLTTTDARNVSVTGTYDNLNRLKKRDYSDTTADVDFYYDGRGLPSVPNFSKGKTTRVASSVSETRYTSFDNLGRLLSSEQRTPFADETAENATPRVSTYQYNLSGALVQETYPSLRTVSYNLDQDGDLESVWGQKPNNSAKLYLNQIKYNSAGAIERMRLGNGRWESAVYNSRQQITQIGLGYSDTDKSLLKLDYDYGSNTQNNGSLIQQKISFRGLTSEIKQDYIYDNLNRLKSSTETVDNQVSWKQTFNYDRYGNRTFDSANTTTINQSVSWKATNPLINTGDNRLKKDQDGDTVADYDYDKAGNLTLDAENRRFVFDAENRMKEFFHSSNASSTPDAVYSYDGEGRRVKKVTGNRTVIFVYNSSGTLVAEYDSQLATNPQVNYLTADHLGSPRVITDGRGAVISRHDYMAFGSDITETIGNVGGRTTQQGFNSADDVRKQYTGYERDDESGLDFAQARYYNSNHGRFTSVDPLTASATIRNPQTFNRYSYVLNSPYKFVDPLGLISVDTGACGNRCKNWGGGGGGFVGLYSTNGQTIGIGYRNEGAGPVPQSAEHPPNASQGTQGETQQQDQEAQLRSQFPTLDQPDGNTVNLALMDARNAVSPAAAFGAILTMKYRSAGDTTTPSQALESISASTASSITVTRDANGQVTNATVAENAVYDGRRSTLMVDDDNNPNTPDITVSQFFQNNPTVNAITYAGYIFVGQGFFNQNADGRAKSMVHEGVVHKGFKRSDTEFGATRTEGSRAINAVIDRYYIRRDPVIINTAPTLPSTTIVPRTP